MLSNLKNKLLTILLASLFIIWCIHPLYNFAEATPPKYDQDYASLLKKDGRVLNPAKFGVELEKEGESGKKREVTLRENIVSLFYPRYDWKTSAIYWVLRGITLWVMIIFIVVAGASLLLNKKPEESKKHLSCLLYIMLWWVFIYASNRLFGSVLNFNQGDFTLDPSGQQAGGLWWFTRVLIWKGSVFFVVLSAIKAFAFFLAIIMIVVTWFKVIAAWDWEKWKKLVKWIVNVVVALLIIKWVDFIYYLAADSSTFIENTSNLIINVAKVFAWIYWVIVFIMVLVAGYLYITDWWDGSSFKKASNVLVNILLSALVLFGFLLITYQIFAEFQKGWDAVTVQEEDNQDTGGSTAYFTVDKNYI